VTYDAHQHIWPESLVRVLRDRRDPPCLRGDVLETAEGSFAVDVAAHLPEARLAALEQAGVDAAIVSLQPTIAPTEDVAEAYHEGMAAVADERLRPLAHAAALDGFAGASIPAEALLDLDAIAPLLDDLQQRSQLLFVHPGPGTPAEGAPGWWCAVVDYTAQMQSAYAHWLWHGVERWPRLRVLFAILAGGAPFQLERLVARGGLQLRDVVAAEVYLDTSSYGPRALEFCMSVYGVERLVHGSDAPVLDASASIDAVRTFGQAVTAALCDRNPTRLLA
jgi:hypothetical protein